MGNAFFQFKQFCVYHDKCAMKVGTDGVLLGAWADVSGVSSVLDIGTGSGLIALMLAQRSKAEIDAIDIEYSAYLQATENVDRSPFDKQIRVHHIPLNNYAQCTAQKYDLIVSNPPYFQNALHSPVTTRTIARHNDKLTLNELLTDSLNLLADKGRIALILPFDLEKTLNTQASPLALSVRRKTYIRPKPGSDYKRLLIEFTREKSECQINEFTLEKSRHQYTDEYIALTKDFYLKM